MGEGEEVGEVGEGEKEEIAKVRVIRSELSLWSSKVDTSGEWE